MAQSDRDTNCQPPSPCNRHCCLNEDDMCIGCFRTLDEILQWSASDSEEKMRIIAECKKRRAESRR